MSVEEFGYFLLGLIIIGITAKLTLED